jgi:type III pantothenate kinase
MIVTLDIGNTSILCGVFRGNKLVYTFRISSDARKMEDEYGILFLDIFKRGKIRVSQIRGFCICCVVPPLLPIMEAMISKYFGARVIILGPGTKTGMPILYDNPKDVGADRIANAVGAWRLYMSEARGNRGLVVVDLGTATTFDCISQKGEYMGGAIVPGIIISLEALFMRTSKLPKVEVQVPPSVIGRNTPHSIQAGVVFGYASMIDGIIEKISKEMGAKPFVVATGGYSKLICSFTKHVDIVDENITLFGLKFIFDMNIE